MIACLIFPFQLPRVSLAARLTCIGLESPYSYDSCDNSAFTCLPSVIKGSEGTEITADLAPVAGLSTDTPASKVNGVDIAFIQALDSGVTVTIFSAACCCKCAILKASAAA